MTFKNSLKTAVRGLKAQRTRSALTTLGIVIGITAIMIVVSIGANAEGVITSELGGLGAESIVVRPGKEPKGPMDFAEVLLSDSLKAREYEALLKKVNVPDLVAAAPEVFVTGSASYRGETFRPLILGFRPKFMMEAFSLELAEGVIFDEPEIRAKSQVAVIGAKVKQELFGQKPALGENIDIKGTKFRVLGILKPKGQVIFFNVDELVVIPYTSAQTYLTGTKHFNQILVRASSPAAVNETVEDIKRTLRSLHGISEGEDDDFSVQTQQGLVEQVSTIIGVFTIFLSFVVAISLLVGGIGIMNIMLVSVTERTREIGLRKALGAKNRDILVQFLLEATLLTGLGGVAGIVMGSVFSFASAFVLSRIAGIAFAYVFPVTAVLLGLGVSAFVGVAFGIYPARKASLKSPIEALRYE